MYNDRLIEIKSGLKEKQRVLLSPQSASDNIDLSGSIVANEEKKTEATNAEAGGKTNSDAAPAGADKKAPAGSPTSNSDRKKLNE